LLLADIKKGESLLVDVLLVNNKNCINVAGLGFDSFVAHEFHKSKGRGLKNYILSTIKSVFAFNPFDAALIVDGKNISDKYQMISIANTRQFGNNALVSPQSKPNDGVFEIVLVKPFPIYLYPTFIVKMFRGTLKESKYISYLSVNESAEITSVFKHYHVDGEPKVFEEGLIIKMQENKIRVLQTSWSKLNP
jgi:diacylglycerol kinase family enzyme